MTRDRLAALVLILAALADVWLLPLTAWSVILLAVLCLGVVAALAWVLAGFLLVPVDGLDDEPPVELERRAA